MTAFPKLTAGFSRYGVRSPVVIADRLSLRADLPRVCLIPTSPSATVAVHARPR
jgi:hypothetical protein